MENDKHKNICKKHPLWESIKNTVQHHPLLSAGLLIAIVGTIIAGILPPLVLERIVNQLAAGNNIALSLILLYLLLLFVSGIFDAVKECLITVFGQKVTHGIRSTMAQKLVRLQAPYYVKNEHGVIVSRFVNDVDTVETLFTSGIISMVVDACKVLSILIIIFVKSKGLGGLMILVTPLLFVMTMFFQKRMLAAQLENRVAVGRANNHVPETIETIRMIHTFHSEGYMKERYATYIEDGFQAMEKSNFYDAIYSPIIITISSAIIAVMMVCSAMGGGMQTFFGMSVGTAVAVISYVSKVFEPLESIGMEIQNIQSAVAGIYRLNEFLKEEEREPVLSKKIDFDYTKPAISFSKVHFGYEKDQEIIHGYSFAIQNGENVTLTGRTGIGKSTVFKLLLGLYQPWDGKVSIYGVPVSDIPDEQKAKMIGYVEQSFHMIPGDIADQITLKDPSISAEQVIKVLHLVGLWDVVETLEKGIFTACKESIFSQGQIQLLSIARAVVCEPRILLLDEITANLDSATEENVLKALEKASEDRTVLSISHRQYSEKGKQLVLEEYEEFGRKRNDIEL